MVKFIGIDGTQPKRVLWVESYNMFKKRDGSLNLGQALKTHREFFKEHAKDVGICLVDLPSSTKGNAVEALRHIHDVCQTHGIDTIVTSMQPIWGKSGMSSAPFRLSYGHKVDNESVIFKGERVIRANTYKIIACPSAFEYIKFKQTAEPALELVRMNLDSGASSAKKPGWYLEEPDVEIIVPKTREEIKKALIDITNAGKFATDIEATGLDWRTDKLLTVAFAISDKKAYVFPVLSKDILDSLEDYYNEHSEAGQLISLTDAGNSYDESDVDNVSSNELNGNEIKNVTSKLFYKTALEHLSGYDNVTKVEILKRTRQVVLGLLTDKTKHVIGHNWLGYDHAFIMAELAGIDNMRSAQARADLVFKNKIDDTMLMAYILQNSTDRAKVGLKDLSYMEFGSYDEDIDQSVLVDSPFEKVARYNGIDAIATYRLYNRFSKELEDTKVSGVYDEGHITLMDTYNRFLKVGKMLLVTKMEGLRIDLERARKLFDEIEESLDKSYSRALKLESVKEATEIIIDRAMEKGNSKRVNPKPREFYATEFNFNSSAHKSVLFYDVLGLPEIIKSKTTGNPSTSAAAIEAWKEEPTKLSEETLELFDLLEDISAGEKILNTYLSRVFTDAVNVSGDNEPDDYRIFSNFNQTRVITGRLSTSGGINLLAMPSGSMYGKAFKSIFIAPEGYVFTASDFGALEIFGGPSW